MRRKRVYSSGHGWGARIFRGVKSVTLVFCVVLLPLCYILEFGNPFLSYPGSSPLQKVYSDHAKLMKHRHGLTSGGAGMGWEQQKVNRIIIGYSSNRVVSIEEAREIWVDSLVSLLDLLNNTDVNPDEYADTPMTYLNTRLKIRFATSREDLEFNPNDQSVVAVLQSNEVILFTTYEPGEVMLGTLHEETCEEALKIVRESKSGSKSLVE